MGTGVSNGGIQVEHPGIISLYACFCGDRRQWYVSHGVVASRAYFKQQCSALRSDDKEYQSATYGTLTPNPFCRRKQRPTDLTGVG